MRDLRSLFYQIETGRSDPVSPSDEQSPSPTASPAVPSRRQTASLCLEPALTLESQGSVTLDLTNLKVILAIGALPWNPVMDFWLAPGAQVSPC